MTEEANFADLLERAFGLLERGAANRKDDFHTPALATINSDDAPEIRTVVLRKFARESLLLMCHVDLRSPKIAEIERNNRVSWLFYHDTEKLQLRARGQAEIHTDDDLAQAQWDNSQLFSRRCYCGDQPGTIKNEPSSGLPDFLQDREPTEIESEQLGRQNFAVLTTKIAEIDFYELNIRGHRRSLFIFSDNGELETRWLTP